MCRIDYSLMEQAFIFHIPKTVCPEAVLLKISRSHRCRLVCAFQPKHKLTGEQAQCPLTGFMYELVYRKSRSPADIHSALCYSPCRLTSFLLTALHHLTQLRLFFFHSSLRLSCKLPLEWAMQVCRTDGHFRFGAGTCVKWVLLKLSYLGRPMFAELLQSVFQYVVISDSETKVDFS